jgi:hypothetical protein
MHRQSKEFGNINVLQLCVHKNQFDTWEVLEMKEGNGKLAQDCCW